MGAVVANLDGEFGCGAAQVQAQGVLGVLEGVGEDFGDQQPGVVGEVGAVPDGEGHAASVAGGGGEGGQVGGGGGQWGGGQAGQEQGDVVVALENARPRSLLSCTLFAEAVSCPRQ